MPEIMLKLCGKYCNKKPDDYVIATGKQLSIRQFINLVSKTNMNIAGKEKDLKKKATTL